MNLLSLMPSFWTADPALKTLIGAVQAAMDDYLADVRALLQSGAASTARKPFIDGWESFYGTQPDPSASIDARRSAIMAKMRAGGICTPQKIIDLAASYSGGEIEVEEDPASSSLIVRFVDQQGTPDYIDKVKAEISAILPAHLTVTFEYTYLTIAEVEAMTLDELEETTLDHFGGGSY